MAKKDSDSQWFVQLDVTDQGGTVTANVYGFNLHYNLTAETVQFLVANAGTLLAGVLEQQRKG